MQAWFDFLTIALIGSTSWLIAVRYIASAIRWLSFQSVMLALYTFALAVQSGHPELYWIAVATLLVKAWLIPYILYRALRHVGVDRQAEKAFGRDLLIVGVLAMWLIGYYVTPQLDAAQGPNLYLSVAIGMLLSGVLIMITHQKAMMQGIGLIVIENGLFLAALSTSLGMPFMVDIGIFLDVLVIVVLIAALTLRMDEQFSSMNIEKLKRLRG